MKKEKPGKFPFTRGLYSGMYSSRLWTMRQYAGFTSAKESNKRFKYLLKNGVMGLSVAFDLPTQIGFDSDDKMAEGEVGRVGVPISTLNNIGIDILLDNIALQSELLELTANADRPAEGAVIEAKLDVGRGPVATVLVQKGTLKKGDIFVVGEQWGKVRALINDSGTRVELAGPSVPVEVLGLNGTPEAGDILNVVSDEAKAREIANYRNQVSKDKKATQNDSTNEPSSEIDEDKFPVKLAGFLPQWVRPNDQNHGKPSEIGLVDVQGNTLTFDPKGQCLTLR